jgi:hypothetical protein
MLAGAHEVVCGRPLLRAVLACPIPTIKGADLAKPNYQYEKRQKELAKKQKQEEKRRQKAKGASDEGSAQAAVAETGMPPADPSSAKPD